MSNGLVTATLDFGAFPGSCQASVAVTGQTTISATSTVEAWFMQDATSDHTSNDHAWAAAFCGITCSIPTAGVGYTITATSTERLSGTFTLRSVWSD